MSDVKLQDLLNDITQALLSGDTTTANRLAKDTPSGLMRLIHNLNATFQPQQPSDQFVQSLKQELIGEHYTMISRMRSLPGRVQIATGVAAIFAGLMWVARRREMRGSGDVELPALQQQP